MTKNCYQPVDQLFLWMLTEPTKPILIGELNMVRHVRGVSLRYEQSWRENGFALSEDLPLEGQDEFFPTVQDTAVGAIDDARPDRWGERVIRLIDKPLRLSLRSKNDSSLQVSAWVELNLKRCLIFRVSLGWLSFPMVTQSILP